VLKFAGDWKGYVARFGRWIDFDKSYKTMDVNFMESVWWVFKQIYEKGFVNRKCKIMPYSTACNTVLSNFEAGMNYQDIIDPSVYITFPLVSDPETKIVAWTTTPWTLSSNLALAVNPQMEYNKIKTEKDILIISAPRLKEVLKQLNITKYEIIGKFKGSELHGLEYIPLFDDFINLKNKGCFKVYSAEFVTSEDGTGIVHIAPAFGMDDYEVAIKYGFIDPESPLCPIDESGYFNKDFPLVYKKHFKEADEIIINSLKEKKRLLSSGKMKHSYPLCYRTDTPLMYRVIKILT
jgi:isoleucyl-tRNA synthetase